MIVTIQCPRCLSKRDHEVGDFYRPGRDARTISNDERRALRALRMKFVVGHPKLWSDAEWMVRALRDAGLLSRKTYIQDAIHAVENTIHVAKTVKTKEAK